VARALAGDARQASDMPVWLIAAGKAAPGMAEAAAAALGNALHEALVIAPVPARLPARCRPMIGEHPQPGRGSELAGREALAMAQAAPADAELLILLSGGASALMAAPADGISLEEKKRVTGMLLRGGADITALNTVRKHLSAIKGGRLAAISRAACRTLAVSDVVGDDLSVIGSGPTVVDPSTFAEAYAVLQRFAPLAQYPVSVVEHLTAGMDGNRPETPKLGDPRLVHSTASVIGGRADAMRGAEAEARARGYHTLLVKGAVVGEARTAGLNHLDSVLQQVASSPRPACVISSGETTVTVTGEGRGGRNQEFALAVAERVASERETITLASIGTDGIDGPTDAAGAIVDRATLHRARAAGLSPPAHFLRANDSYNFFAAIGDLIHTGPTGTNVGDLQVLLVR
jgi:hydroxypyruvate reductase